MRNAELRLVTSRRTFLTRFAGVLAAPTLWGANRKSARLPIAFSTLGCPKWDWDTILRRAVEWGYAAIELRGIQGEMDLTKRPEFGAARLAASLKDLEAANLRVAGLGSSTRLHEGKPATRQAQIDEGKRFIDLAHSLHAPYVRVFGDRWVADEPRAATVDRIVSGLRELGRHAKGSGVTVVIESHGDFCDSKSLLEILKGSKMPTVGLLWDAHHTVVMGHEQPAETLRDLGRYVRHTHLKDSRPEGKGVRYVLTGEGTVPVRDTVKALVKRRYRGFYSFEWEKAWHPEIEEPEVAFPHFARVVRGYLQEAGYRVT